jgi:hypothetical protein
VTLKDPTGILGGDGNPITTAALRYGDIIYLPEEEVRGQTFLANYDGVLISQGAGRVIKSEHAGLSYAELLIAGYQFHEGRSDFEAVEEEPAPAPKTTTTKKATSTEEGA